MTKNNKIKISPFSLMIIVLVLLNIVTLLIIIYFNRYNFESFSEKKVEKIHNYVYHLRIEDDKRLSVSPDIPSVFSDGADKKIDFVASIYTPFSTDNEDIKREEAATKLIYDKVIADFEKDGISPEFFSLVYYYLQ